MSKNKEKVDINLLISIIPDINLQTILKELKKDMEDFEKRISENETDIYTNNRNIKDE